MRNLLKISVPIFALLCAASVHCLEFEDERPAETESQQKGRDYGVHSWHSGLFDFDGGASDLFWPGLSPQSFRENLEPGFNVRKPTVEQATPTRESTNSGSKEREPLDVEFVSGTIGNPDDTEVQLGNRPPIQAPQSGDTFPAFENPTSFFQNGFGSSFGFGNFFPFTFNNQDFKPWWKGDNVCVEREEDLEDWDKESAVPGSGISASFSVNFESCIDKPNKYVCTTISNHGGKKRTVTVTRQCCHGYGQAKGNGGFCEKMDLRDIEETADTLGAKEFINAIKKNGLSEKLSGNVTLFVPLDSAFTDFSEQMFESNLVVLPLGRRNKRASDISGITTKELTLAHMVKGYVQIEDIENEQLLQSEYDNTTIRMNIFPKGPSDNSYEYRYRYTANCVPLLKINKQATNGLIHVVERVLTPVTQNLMDIVRSRSDMAVFRTVLEKTNLSEMLEQEDKTFTVFAPTDSAFEKLDPSLRRTIKEGNSCAMNILKNHILDLTFCSAAVVNKAKTNTYNILGEKLNFERRSTSTKENADETQDLAEVQDIFINKDSRVSETDVMGTNGVLHVIDKILPTESGVPITTMLGKRNLTIFKALVEASGLDEEFDVLSNVSFFAPVDKAFENSKWKADLESKPDSLKNNDELKKFLEYHVGLPYVKTCDLNEDMIKTKSGGDLRVNLYATHPVFSNVMNRATVNCARLIHFDDESCGAVLHQVDKLLEPPSNNLLQLLEATPKYQKFLELVKKANLTSLMEDSTQDYTILVPGNDIFNEQEDWYNRLLESGPELEKFVKTHILPDVLCCAGFVPSDWPFVRTIETINGQNLKIDRTRRPTVANSGIIKCDVVAKNGVLHEINDVIIVKENRRPLLSSSSFF